MCTLTIAYRVFEEAPVVVAANRDELLGRPSTPPRAVDGEPRIVAPGDEEAGGTWIGYNDAGVLVAITNRWVDGLVGERSRGLLVRDALEQPDGESAIRAVERELAARSYEGFNLVIADAAAAVLLEWDGRLRVTELEPGVHVVMNAGFDDRFEAVGGRLEHAERQAASARLIREALDARDDETVESWLDRAGAVLGDHDFGVCVHAGEFGTRSSSLIALFEDGPATYRFADGPPCRTRYRELQI